MGECSAQRKEEEEDGEGGNKAGVECGHMGGGPVADNSYYSSHRNIIKSSLWIIHVIHHIMISANHRHIITIMSV